MIKAFFARKPANLAQYFKCMGYAMQEGTYVEQEYEPIAKVTLSKEELWEFWHDFYRDREWLKPYADEAVGNKCVVVDCPVSNSVILVITEGYCYARYVAIVCKPIEEE